MWFWFAGLRSLAYGDLWFLLDVHMSYVYLTISSNKCSPLSRRISLHNVGRVAQSILGPGPTSQHGSIANHYRRQWSRLTSLMLSISFFTSEYGSSILTSSTFVTNTRQDERMASMVKFCVPYLRFIQALWSCTQSWICTWISGLIVFCCILFGYIKENI